MSVDFFRVCIVTHRKIIQLFCGFSYFSVGIFWNQQKNHNFSVRAKKNPQKNSSPTEQFDFPVVNPPNPLEDVYQTLRHEEWLGPWLSGGL